MHVGGRQHDVGGTVLQPQYLGARPVAPLPPVGQIVAQHAVYSCHHREGDVLRECRLVDVHAHEYACRQADVVDGPYHAAATAAQEREDGNVEQEVAIKFVDVVEHELIGRLRTGKAALRVGQVVDHGHGVPALVGQLAVVAVEEPLDGGLQYGDAGGRCIDHHGTVVQHGPCPVAHAVAIDEHAADALLAEQALHQQHAAAGARQPGRLACDHLLVGRTAYNEHG